MRPSFFKPEGSRGFSLLEAMLATGILSVVLAQIVSVHANSLAASQAAIDNMKATWAMRSAIAQIEYVVDVYGAKDGFRPEVKMPWPADNNFTIEIYAKPATIEASRLLMSAMRLGQALAGAKPDEGGGGENDPAEMIKGMASQIDAFVPKDVYKQVAIAVTWKQGEQSKGIDSGMFLVDSKNLKPDLGALGGAAGGLGEDSGGGGGRGNGGGLPPPQSGGNRPPNPNGGNPAPNPGEGGGP